MVITGGSETDGKISKYLSSEFLVHFCSVVLVSFEIFLVINNSNYNGGKLLTYHNDGN